MASTLLNHLTAWELRGLIRSGKTTSVEIVGACLSRMNDREGDVRAWAYVNQPLAMHQARLSDESSADLPLKGIPVAIKDVYDTFDLPTQMGSPIYADYQPVSDAAVVSLLRQAGAIILGKTVTAEFAGMAATETRNPLSLTHTPGGSSSGSAAAVADNMTPLAIGTQTGGSVLRPASFCGIFGFKPTYGRINRAGMKFAAESLDTVGWMSRSIQDLSLLDGVLSASSVQEVRPVMPLRIGICLTHLWQYAERETRTALEEVTVSLKMAGVEVLPFDWPDGFAQLSAAREIINDYERAQALAHEWSQYRDSISTPLARSIKRGLQISHDSYVNICREAAVMRGDFERRMQGFDALITPCVNGEAPLGLDYAGDPRFQSIWTLLHVPALGLPTHKGPTALPVSVQLIGVRYSDAHLLRMGQWIYSLVRSTQV